MQSLSPGYSLIDFEFDGDEAPLFLFDFDQPAYGFVYTRPHFLVTLAVGDQSADEEGREDLRLVDVGHRVGYGAGADHLQQGGDR